MRRKKQSISTTSIQLGIGLALAMSVALWLYIIPPVLENTRPVAYVIPEETKRDCLKGAEDARSAFVGTKFESWNFYHSCVLNVECTTPLHACPTEEIYEQSKFFVEK